MSIVTMPRKALACALCAAILLPGPIGGGAAALAADPPKTPTVQAPPIDPQAAVRFFEQNGVFKDAGGQRDPLRSYLYDKDDGKLTAIGELLYRHLQSAPKQPPPTKPGTPPVAQPPQSPAAPPLPAEVRKRVDEMKDTFDGLRKLGPMTDTQRQEIDKSIARMKQEYGGGTLGQLSAQLGKAGGDEFMQGALLRAGFDGAAQRGKGEPQASPYTQVDTPNGFVFMDKEGVAVRMTKNYVCREGQAGKTYEMTVSGYEKFKQEHEAAGDLGKYMCGVAAGVTVFNRELQTMQQRMNDPKTKPSCAPHVPETGRYNYEMLQYSSCRLEDQVKLLEKGYELDRLSRIAELLGEQYHDDQFLKDAEHGGTLKAALLKKAERSLDDIPFRRKKLYDSTCNGYVTTVLELVDCKLAKRKDYLDKTRQALELYQKRVTGYRERQVITEQDVQGMQADEKLISKYVTLTYLEQQRFHGAAQLERLNFEMQGESLQVVKGKSPDSHFLEEALKTAPFSEQTRQKYGEQAQALAQRTQRLMLMYDKLDKDINKADHVTGLDRIQAVLGQTQKELAEVGLDYAVYMNTPSLAKVAAKEGQRFEVGWSGWHPTMKGLTPSVTLGLAKAGNWTSGLWGGKWFDGYITDRRNLDNYNAGMGGVADLLASGDFKGARQAVISLAPDAIRTHAMTELSGAGEEGTEPQRVQASLRQVQEDVSRVAKVHVYSGIAINIAAWSLAMAVAAPAASALLSGAAKGCFTAANAVKNVAQAAQAAGNLKTAMALRTLAVVPQAAGAILQHSAIRLATLSAAPDKLYASTKLMRVLEGGLVRYVNTSARMMAFSLLMSGGMSGTMNAMMYTYNRTLGDGNTPYSGDGTHLKKWLGDGKAGDFAGGAWSAFAQGWTQGAQWASGAGEQWWTPMILFAGFSADAFEGTPIANAANNLASKGLVGNVSAVVSKIPGMGWMGKYGIESLAKMGGWGKGLGTILAMGDQVAKYMVISQGAGHTAEFLSRRFNSYDGDNIERAIKRARAASLYHQQIPYWLLMPVYPAKYEVQAQAAQKSSQGFEEYKEVGELDTIANAAENTTLPLKHDPKVPMSQKIFNFRWRGESGRSGTFMVTKDMKYEAIKAELPNAIAGGKPGGPPVDPMSVNPLEYYKVSQKESGMIGRLHMSDEVRDQAQGLFEQAILKKPGLAEQILNTQAGSNLPGFGTVRQGVQQEVARIVYLNQATMPKAQVAIAEKVLGPYLETERIVDGKAKALLAALHDNVNPSQGFQTMLEDIMRQTREWTAAGGKGSYMDLVSKWREQAQAARLSPAEAKVLTSAFDYIDAIQGRFEYFNKMGTASQRATAAVEAIQTEYASGSARTEIVTNMLQKMATTIRAELGSKSAQLAVVGGKALRVDPADPKSKTVYEAMVEKLKTEVKGMKGLSLADQDVLNRAIKEMEASPYLLRNVQGDGLPGWRDVQFEGLMFFLNSIAADGTKASETIRTFLLMKTGAGKTLIAYEGLLPIAEADAAGRGKKTMFLTVQSNLESQARMDYRALKKLLPKLQIDTWEGFKSKMAQGKLNFGEKPDDYWILGDEMDGAALQPALTIGETTAGITKDNPGYSLLKKMGDRMKEIMRRGPGEVQKRLEAEVRQQQSIVDGMEPGEAKQKLQQTTKDLLQMSRHISELQGENFRVSRDPQEALRRAEGVVKNLTSGNHPGQSPETAKELQDLVTQLKGADKTAAAELVQRIDGKMREVWTIQNNVAIERLSGRIDRLVQGQNDLLGGMDASKAQTFRNAGAEIQKTLVERQTLGGGNLELAREQFEAMAWEQRSVLNQTEPAGQQTARTLKTLAKTLRAEGQVAEAQKVEAQAQQVLESASLARRGLEANSKQIMGELKAGKPGWEARVRELVQQREVFVEKAVVKENPIYEIFRSMRNDMYQLYSSRMRVTSSAEVLEEAPFRASQSLETQGKSLVENAESLVQRYRALESAGGPGKAEATRLRQVAENLLQAAKTQQTTWNAKAGEMRSILETPTSAEHKALQQAGSEAYRQLVKSELELKALRVQLDAADPGAKAALEKRVADAQSTVDRWFDKVQGIQRDLSSFEPAQRQMIKTQLEGMRTQAQDFSAQWQKQLAQFQGSEASLLRSQLGSMGTGFESQSKRLDWNSDRAVEVLQRRINGVGTGELALRYGLQYTGLRWLMSQVPGMGEKWYVKPITPVDKGLTRTYAGQLMKAFANDPFLAPDVKWKMIWTLAPSTLSPRGSWVQTELFNLARGHTDPAGNVRIDNITGKVNVIHNGQWFESMDTPTRRFWEIEYGADLTLPYEHKTIVTMNDFIKDNHNVRFVGFSGTAGKEFRDYVSKQEVHITGIGSATAKDVPIKITQSAGGKYTEINDAVRQIRAHDAANVAAGKQADGLVVVTLSDTRSLKVARQALIKAGLVKPDEIAMVFSDAELLRINRPDANVSEQMNLGSLTPGKVKVLMLDTRVGGRGLDLNFKGVRNGTPDQFHGYNRFEMVIADPQLASEAHFVQAQGRIDVGRVPKGAERNFRMVMDLPSAEKEPTFMRMVREDPLFRQLKTYPEVMELTQQAGKFRPDWGVIETYIQGKEQQLMASPEYLRFAEGRKLSPTDVRTFQLYMNSGSGTGDSYNLVRRYNQTVRRYLDAQQLEIEKSALRSASVLQGGQIQDQFMNGLFPINPITPAPGGLRPVGRP